LEALWKYPLHVKRTSARKNIVGGRVAKARRSFSPALTQDALSGQLARRGVQLDRAAIAKIENGLRHVLDYELKALAHVLSVEVDWLLGDEKERER
jgi:transcriptional regulator with XRE-family HTH domain